ncbi:MAG: U32 family peptidase [Betaproteobacteria bacterium]|nr:U32 family peptidase [Betaproteobacteria bacterium]
MKLALGPVLYYWTQEKLQKFYEGIAAAPVDIVYLGETVCSRRHIMRLSDWLEVAKMLAAAGKEVVLSTLTLIESESDLKTLRRIAENSNFAVEANDMGAVHRLAGRMPFIAGPYLNIYNPQTLHLVASLGARRWVMPVEMSHEALQPLQQSRPAGVETEVFSYGRLPLAFSSRCFTARFHNLPKDDCRFLCIDDPNGKTMRTREGKPFLVINGTQTQSALVYNLIGDLDSLRKAGVDVVRISPQSEHTAEIIRLFRDRLEQRISPENATQQMESMMPEAACNGYWHGRPGMEQMFLASAMQHE